MKKVLSTKKLSIGQKELLLNAGFSFVEYNAISISPLDFEAPEYIKYAIFTSANAVDKVFADSRQNPRIEYILCVGHKTTKKLTDLGQNIVKTAKNASDLGNFIVKNFKNEDFYFFCGTLRRGELLNQLNPSKNRLFEVKTYKTDLNIKKFDQNYDGIMFFSPSAVISFTNENELSETRAFCIGETTASEAKKHTNNVYISNSTSTESVIAKTVKILREYD